MFFIEITVCCGFVCWLNKCLSLLFVMSCSTKIVQYEQLNCSLALKNEQIEQVVQSVQPNIAEQQNFNLVINNNWLR